MSRSHEESVLTDTRLSVERIESQARTPSSHHEDVDRIVDHATGQDDKEQRCHHANKVHKGRFLALQKLWVLSTEREAVEMLAGLGRSIAALCCNVAVASDLRPSPSQGKS